jgi:hypothetical protein
MKIFSQIFSRNSNLTLSKCEVAQKLCEKMRERYKKNRFTVINPHQPDEVRIDITGTDGHTFSCYVDSLYSTYLGDPSRLGEFCENMLTTVDSLLLNTDEVRPLLLPAIKNQSWIERVQHTPQQEKDSSFFHTTSQQYGRQLAHIPLVADLSIVFALDTPHHMSYVFNEQLHDFSAADDIQEVYQQALENLKTHIPGMKIKASPLGYTVHVDSNYDASMILLYDQWKERIALRGDPVIAIVARGTLIIADSDNTKQIHDLRKFVQDIFPTVAYSLSPLLFTIKDEQLSIFSADTAPS